MKKVTMKMITVFLLSAVFAVSCMGLTACGGSEEEAQPEEQTTEATQEETTAPAQSWGEYGYMGEDPVEGAVYESELTTKTAALMWRVCSRSTTTRSKGIPSCASRAEAIPGRCIL